MFPQVPLLLTGEYKADQVQKNIIQPLNQLLKIPFADGVWLKDISLLSASTNNIAHKLGREYLGYIILKQNANAVIYVGANTEKTTYLKLNATANVTIDVWVF